MQIVFDDKGFSVAPSSDRRIIEQFVDYETGYLVVSEINQSNPADRAIYYTLVDKTTGKIISPETRREQVDTSERVTVDRQHNLKITTERTIDVQTGQEKIVEKIVDILTGKEVLSKRSVAFSKVRRETALETYLKRLSENDEAKRFWREEYPVKSLEDRKGYWLAYIYRDMRTMGEIGQDEYSIFSKENYRDWKAKEPDIDTILDYVLEQLPRMWPGEEDKIRQKIKAMRS